MKKWLSRRASPVRRVGVAVISSQVWYLDNAPPRKIRVRTVLRSTYRMHVIIVLYVTAVVQRASIITIIGPSYMRIPARPYW